MIYMWPDRLREAHVCFLYLSLILIKSRFLAKGTAVLISLPSSELNYSDNHFIL